MRTSRWTRSFLLYAATIFAASQTIACQESSTPSAKEDAPIITDVYPPCKNYVAMPEAYGYCLYKFSGGFRSAKEIEHFCPQAGEWEMECRHAWVSGRMQPDSGYKTEDLIKVCGENPDCTFELIDFRPEKDILAQIDLCTNHVKKHIQDCVGHAMQRWWYTKPDAEEVARVLKNSSPVPDRVAFYAAASVQCSGIGTCEGDPYLVRICQKNMRHFKKYPKTCPPQEEPKMENQFSPTELTPQAGHGAKGTNVRPPPKFDKPPQGIPPKPRQGHVNPQNKTQNKP